MSAKVDINMHALVLFICGLYQMPASVYELMVQSISDVPLLQSLHQLFCYLLFRMIFDGIFHLIIRGLPFWAVLL